MKNTIEQGDAWKRDGAHVTVGTARPLAHDFTVVSSNPPLYHYVIVRADLPHGVQVAQTVHAAGESCEGPLPSGTYAVALAVRDEEHLLEVADDLWNGEVPFKMIVETDGEFAGQHMTLGIFPTRDRGTIRKFTSSLPLVR